MLIKKELADTLGLSCVEKYFLAWLGKYYNVNNLYSNSFVGLNRLFDAFAHGATYENYCDIERLQDLAEEYGIVEHKYISCRADEAIDIISRKKENELFLIRVNTRFFLDFKRSSWREDHYICIENDLSWINEYPLSEGKFDKNKFEAIFDGAICIYNLGDLSVIPPNTIEYAVRNERLDMLPNVSLNKFEGALGILRITRKRMFTSPNIPKEVKQVLAEEIKIADKLYFSVRLKRLKAKDGEKKELVATEQDMKSIIECEKFIWGYYSNYDSGKN